MPLPEITLSTRPALETDAEVIVIGVGSDSGTAKPLPGSPEIAGLDALISAVGATGSTDEVVRLAPPVAGMPSIVLAGIGSSEPDVVSLRGAAGAAVRKLSGVDHVALALPVGDAADARAALEGAAVAAYSFREFKSEEPKPGSIPPARITLHAPELPESDARSAEAVARASAGAIHLVRDLVNTPAYDLPPAVFAERASALVADLPIEVEVLDETRLQDEGYGGIWGVGRGSERPPRLVVLRYAPAAASRHLAFVGKGITFDSGGLSLKPASSMNGMKYDMTGAATVLAATIAAAQLELPVQITTRLCLAENMPSGSATRPGDVLRIRGGATVEVTNTDAEGRLVLADGLVASSEEHPDAIVDVATLTGAARVALGERTVPVMGDTEFVTRALELGTAVGETLWHMPLPAELRGLLDSDVADMVNARPGQPAAGMLLAGRFLQHFVGTTSDEADAGRIPWAHFDIAGCASNGGAPYRELAKGPTGVTVRTLLALAEDFASTGS